MSISIPISIGALALGLGLRLPALCRATEHQTSACKGRFRFGVSVTNRRGGRLEMNSHGRDDERQFYPVAPAVYRQLLAAKPMYLFLNNILASRSLRERRMRTEAAVY